VNRGASEIQRGSARRRVAAVKSAFMQTSGSNSSDSLNAGRWGWSCIFPVIYREHRSLDFACLQIPEALYDHRHRLLDESLVSG
jgi:hypothetical protein